MLVKEQILELAKKNNGVLLSQQVNNAGLPRWAVRSLVDDELLIHVQRGVYVTTDGYADDYFLLQQRFPQGIYSHETALYLLGYSDRVPVKINMTFQQGESTSRMKKENIRAVMVTNNYDVGLMSLKQSSGTMINVYNIERYLVDLLKTKYDTDQEQFIPALKRYAKSESRDINKLFEYAHIFGVEDKLRSYMQVLL